MDSGEWNVTKFDKTVSSNIFIVQLPGVRSSRDSAELRKMNISPSIKFGWQSVVFRETESDFDFLCP